MCKKNILRISFKKGWGQKNVAASINNSWSENRRDRDGQQS